MATTDGVQRKTYGAERRLLNASDFRYVFDHVDCKQGGPHFTFLSASNQLSTARLGVIVAKKHIPLAVKRNQIKRQIRETFRLVASDSPEWAADIVVLCKSSANSLDQRQLHATLRQQWQRLQAKRSALCASSSSASNS